MIFAVVLATLLVIRSHSLSKRANKIRRIFAGRDQAYVFQNARYKNVAGEQRLWFWIEIAVIIFIALVAQVSFSCSLYAGSSSAICPYNWGFTSTVAPCCRE